MSVIAEIELKKGAVLSCGLTPTAITFNQSGWNKLIDEVHEMYNQHLGNPLTTKTFLNLSVHFDMKQKEDFLIGVF